MSGWTGAPISAVTAWHIPVSFGWTPGSSYVPPEMHPEADAERMLKEVLADVFADEPALAHGDQPPSTTTNTQTTNTH
ncbi:MAG: hypothetical protein QOE23_3374 [Pseudonocardiales bacterium]|jgi:hypothetical protein|nr:hypothetical protein [Pseudonocardiales bacterium]